MQEIETNNEQHTETIREDKDVEMTEQDWNDQIKTQRKQQLSDDEDFLPDNDEEVDEEEDRGKRVNKDGEKVEQEEGKKDLEMEEVYECGRGIDELRESWECAFVIHFLEEFRTVLELNDFSAQACIMSLFFRYFDLCYFPVQLSCTGFIHLLLFDLFVHLFCIE